MILGKTAVSVNTTQQHPLTNMPITRPTLETTTTIDVSLTGNNIPFSKVRDFLSSLHNFPRKLVAQHKRRLDSLRHQFVPVVDLHVCAADRRSLNAYQNVAQSRFRGRRPRLIDSAWTRLCFDDGVHLVS